jgi:hypothetical protein
VTLRVLWMQPGEGDPDIEYSAKDDRQVLWAVFNQPGVLNSNGGDLKVSQRAAGANFSVDVAAGRAVVLGTDVTGQGFYLIDSDEVVNIEVPAPPGSGSRTHRIVAQVKDKLHNSSDWSTYEWEPVLIEDTGDGYPDAPDSSLTLAQVLVESGQTSVTDSEISDQRKNAVTTLGIGRYVLSDAGRPQVPWEGELVYRADKKVMEMATDDAGGWEEIPRRGGGGSAWSTYTPSWTSDGTNPSIGNGSRIGRYERIGRTVHVSAKIIMGSSTSYGSGQYSLSLPVAALTDNDGQVLSCEVRDVSTGEIYQGHARVFSSTSASLRVQGTGADMNAVSQGGPITLATGDVIRIFGTYEAAS